MSKSEFATARTAAVRAVEDSGAVSERRWLVGKRFVVLIAGLLLISSITACDTPSPTSAASSSSSVASATPTAPETQPASTTPTEEATPTEEPPSYAGDYDGAFGTFTTLKKSGAGDSVVKLPAGLQGALVTLKHRGSSNFVVQTLTAKNEDVDLLVNEIGNYSGTTLIGGREDEAQAAKLKIQADGSWTLSVRPVSTAPAWKDSLSGKGDAVFLFDHAAGEVAFTHKGSSNFVVSAIGNGDGLLVNEIGKYSGTVPLGDGPAVIQIQADGAWVAKTT